MENLAVVDPHKLAETSHPELSSASSTLTSEYFSLTSQSKRGPGRPKKDTPLGSCEEPTVFGAGTRRRRYRASSSNAVCNNVSSVNVAPAIPYHLSGSSTSSPSAGSSSPGTPIVAGSDLSAEAINVEPNRCALCYLPESVALGLDFLIKIPALVSQSDHATSSGCGDSSSQCTIIEHPELTLKINLKQLRTSRISNNTKLNTDDLSDWEQVGLPEDLDVGAFLSRKDLYVHHACAIWSLEGDMSDKRLIKLVDASCQEVCSFCSKKGASLRCCLSAGSCHNIYHLACAQISSCFMHKACYSILCPEHSVEAKAMGFETRCMNCGQDINFWSSMVFCELCGYPSHLSCCKIGHCMELTVQANPGVRAGWQCSRCRVCRKCKIVGDQGKLASCDVCDKVFHTHCATPALSSAPKGGWKCMSCRKCDDCGSKTPGSGLSSRWHSSYSVCDSCYQQRNKGCACPICGKAYRIINQKFMRECTQCKKFVHGECDTSIPASTSVYVCRICREQPNATKIKVESAVSGQAHQYLIPGQNYQQQPHQQHDVGGASSSNFSLSSATNRSSSIYSAEENDEDMLNDILKSEAVQSPLSDLDISCIDGADNFNLDTWTAAVEEEFGGNSSSEGFVPPLAVTASMGYQHCSSSASATLYQQAPQALVQRHSSSGLISPNGRKRPPNSKRPPKGKGGGARSAAGRRGRSLIRSFRRTAFSAQDPITATAASSADVIGDSDGLASSTATSSQASPDGDEYTHIAVMDTIDQQYMFTRDICIVSGSLGKGAESDLIPCVECGQCYHLYCADVKLNPVVVQRGWRCLNCTICEGCGRANDEQHLLLCDECDYSVHTYCLDPPLSGIPTGSWTCHWCSRCSLCEAPLTNSTHKVSSAKDSLLKLCVKCESSHCCPLCRLNYKDRDIVIKCEKCQKWSHSKCNGLLNEEAAENAAGQNFKCVLCRPGYIHTLDDSSPEKLPEVVHSVDGVLLTKSGVSTIRWRPTSQHSSGRKPIGFSGVGQGAQRAIDDVVDSVAALFSDKKSIQDQNVVQKDFCELIDEENSKNPNLKWARRFKVGLGGFSIKQVRHRFGQQTTGSGENMSREECNFDTTGDKLGPGAGNTASIQCEEKGATQGFQSALKRRKRQRRKGQLDEAYPPYIQEAFFGFPANCLLNKILLDDVTELENSSTTTSTVGKNDGNIIKGSKSLASNPNPPITTAQELSVIGDGVDPLGRETVGLFGEDAGLQSSSDFSNILDMLMNEDIDDVLGNPSFGSQPKSFENSSTASNIECLGQPPSSQAQHTQAMQGSRTTQSSNCIHQRSLATGNHLSFMTQTAFVEGTPNATFQAAQQRFATPVIAQQAPRFPTVPVDRFVAPPVPPPPPPPPPSYSLAVQALQAPPTFCQPQPSMFNLSTNNQSQAPPPSPASLNFDSPTGYASSTPAGPTPPQPSSMFESSAAVPSALTTPTPSNGNNSLDSKSTLDRWESDEPLGEKATTAAVLYANLHHPQLRQKFPHWPERAKQIGKLWRLLAPDQRQRFVLLARENRALSRHQNVKVAVKNPEEASKQQSPLAVQMSPNMTHTPEMLFKVPTTPSYVNNEYPVQNMTNAQQTPHPTSFAACDTLNTSVSLASFTTPQQQVQSAGSVIKPIVKTETVENRFISPAPSPLYTTQSDGQYNLAGASETTPSPDYFASHPPRSDLKVTNPVSCMTDQSEPCTVPSSCTKIATLNMNVSQLLDTENQLAGEQKTLESRLAELIRHKKALVFKRKQQMIKAGLIVEGAPVVGPLTGLESDSRLEELTRDIGEVQKILEPVKRKAKQHLTLLRDYRHRCGATTPPPKSAPVVAAPSQSGALIDAHSRNQDQTVCDVKGALGPQNFDSKQAESVSENNAPKRKWTRRKRIDRNASNDDQVAHDVALILSDIVNGVIKLVDGVESDYNSHSLLKTLLRSSPITGELTDKDFQPAKCSTAVSGVKRHSTSGVGSSGDSSSPSVARSVAAPARKRARKQTTSTSIPSSAVSTTSSATVTPSVDTYTAFLQRLAVKLAGNSIGDYQKRRPSTMTTQLREPPPRCDAFAIKLGVTSLADKIETLEKSKSVGNLKLNFALDVYSPTVLNTLISTSKNEVLTTANNNTGIRPQVDRGHLNGRELSPSDYVYGSLTDYEEDLQSASYPALKPNFGGVGPSDGRLSPNFRLTAHVPVRAQPADPPPSVLEQMVRSRTGFMRTSASEETISVTLTLSPDASRDIGRVLSGLAALLGMDVPNMDYELRLDTPPSSPINKACVEERKLSCCACKVQVEQAAVRKKYNELGLTCNGNEEEAVFCSSSCFDRFIARLKIGNMKTAEKPDSNAPSNHSHNYSDQSSSSCAKKPPVPDVDVRLDEIIRCVADGSNRPAANDIEEVPSTQSTAVRTNTTPGPLLLHSAGLSTPNVNSLTPLTMVCSALDSSTGADSLKMYGGGTINEQLLNVRDLAVKFRVAGDELASDKAKDKVTKMALEFKLEGSKWFIWSSNDKGVSMDHDCTVEKLRISLKASLYRTFDDVGDQRTCQFCSSVGDDNSDRCGRLLNLDAGQWVHVNCALWSAEVYETMDGGLVNVDRAVQRSQSSMCTACDRRGATLPCYKLHCVNVYHCACAVERRCAFTKDKATTVGYSVSRIFWSKQAVRQRIIYKCSIVDFENTPNFEITTEKCVEPENFSGRTVSEAWMNILKSIESLRGATSKTLKFFTAFLFGEYLFGLTEPSVRRMIESLPGVDNLVARCEPRCRTYIKSLNVMAPAQHLSWPALLAMSGLGSESQALWNSKGGRPTSISKWSQYRKMKQEWKSNVAERREKMYEAHGRGVYMFRMDHERVIDATMSGGPARYINHSCDPNCVTDSVQLNNGDIKIVIATCRPVTEGEELTYDYQFDFEDDARKIPCLCAAPNCRKWMN